MIIFMSVFLPIFLPFQDYYANILFNKA